MSEALQRADPLVDYLTALYDDAPSGSLIELRFRTPSGMSRSFHDIDRLDGVAAAIKHRASQTDVYIGVIPRRRRGGGRDDLVREGHVIWVDCDTADSVVALRRFAAAPSMTVASGTAQNCHAYWLLSHQAPLDAIETANRQLADALGADPTCADAARILRPVSWNHKHDPPTSVRLDRCEPAARYRLDDLIADLPDMSGSRRPGHLPRAAVSTADDPLLAIPPTEYVERLLGVAVPRNGKVPCPFHDDRTPSMHVYREPERGWFCYGCLRGGSVYDLAANLSGATTRGADFVRLRDELHATFDAPLDCALRARVRMTSA